MERLLTDGPPSAPLSCEQSQEHAPAAPRPFDWWWLFSTAGLVILWLAFFGAHLREWQLTGHPIGLGLMAQEAVVAFLFLIRRRPRATSRSLIAWIAALAGTYGALALRPAYGPVGRLEPIFLTLQLAGAALSVICLTSLGRSAGIVAADRGIKTGGAYRLVRHPIYASYLIADLGYLLENPSPLNGAVLLVVWTFQLLRIAEEEAFLRSEPAYVQYQQRVHYRLVPLIF